MTRIITQILGPFPLPMMLPLFGSAWVTASRSSAASAKYSASAFRSRSRASTTPRPGNGSSCVLLLSAAAGDCSLTRCREGAAIARSSFFDWSSGEALPDDLRHERGELAHLHFDGAGE